MRVPGVSGAMALCGGKYSDSLLREAASKIRRTSGIGCAKALT